MAATAASVCTLPAGFAESYLQVTVDLMGRHGAEAVLRRSGLARWIGRPQGSLAGEALAFSDASAWLRGLEETLGPRGARGLGRRMGASAFDRVLRPSGVVAAMRDPAFQALPVDRRLRAGLYSLARVLGSWTSARLTTREDGEGLLLRSEPCPDCTGRQGTAPVCAAMVGLLSAAVTWIAVEASARWEEIACRAGGAPACEFRLRWEPPA